MALRLTILGTSGSYPGPGEACSGYLVRSRSTTLWVDAGPGTLANLQRHVALGDVDAVLLSHEHPDHWTDLNGFFIACKYYQPRDRIPIYAPPGLRDHAFYDGAPLDWLDVTGGDVVAIGDVSVTFSRTDHGPETLAMRFDQGGRSLGYSADSGPGWSMEALGSGLDLALCEATLDRDQEGTTQHMSARQAGLTARAAGAARLVLTHLQPGLDAVQARIDGSEAFDGEVDVARAGAEYEL